MKSLLIFAALLAATIASAQTKAVLKNISGSTITESLTIGSGKTLTIASGATINATGATITGFTASAAWGSVTGTLSAQTDLQSALDLKATLASPTFTGVSHFPVGGIEIDTNGVTAGTLKLNDINGVHGKITTSTLTVTRTATLPDASGTFLFTDGSAANLTNFPTFNQDTTGYASALKSATTTVSVSAATAPSSGQVLTATGASAATWQTPSAGGGGKVLQMVFAHKTDTASGTDTSPATIMSATITPTASTSRIYVMYTGGGSVTNGWVGWINLARGSTAINIADAAGSRARTTTAYVYPAVAFGIQPFSASAIDSPATTSATTYNVQFSVESGGTYYVNRSVSDISSISYPRCASTLILMEIAP